MSAEPLRPTAVETVLYEPDQQIIIAILPGALWLDPGDIVELDDPPRDARVLSSRLQLRDGEARVLVLLDVPDDPEDALLGTTLTDVVMEADGADAVIGDELDEELEQLTDEVGLEESPGDSRPQ